MLDPVDDLSPWAVGVESTPHKPLFVLTPAITRVHPQSIHSPLQADTTIPGINSSVSSSSISSSSTSEYSSGLCPTLPIDEEHFTASLRGILLPNTTVTPAPKTWSSICTVLQQEQDSLIWCLHEYHVSAKGGEVQLIPCKPTAFPVHPVPLALLSPLTYSLWQTDPGMAWVKRCYKRLIRHFLLPYDKEEVGAVWTRALVYELAQYITHPCRPHMADDSSKSSRCPGSTSTSSSSTQYPTTTRDGVVELYHSTDFSSVAGQLTLFPHPSHRCHCPHLETVEVLSKHYIKRLLSPSPVYCMDKDLLATIARVTRKCHKKLCKTILNLANQADLPGSSNSTSTSTTSDDGNGRDNTKSTIVASKEEHYPALAVILHTQYAQRALWKYVVHPADISLSRRSLGVPSGFYCLGKRDDISGDILRARACDQLARHPFQVGDLLVTTDRTPLVVLEQIGDGHTAWVYKVLTNIHTRQCGALKVIRWPIGNPSSSSSSSSSSSRSKGLRSPVFIEEEVRLQAVAQAGILVPRTIEEGPDFILREWCDGERGDHWYNSWVDLGCAPEATGFKSLLQLYMHLALKKLYIKNLKSLNMIWNKETCLWTTVDVGPIRQTETVTEALAHYHHTFDQRWHASMARRAPLLREILAPSL